MVVGPAVLRREMKMMRRRREVLLFIVTVALCSAGLMVMTNYAVWEIAWIVHDYSPPRRTCHDGLWELFGDSQRTAKIASLLSFPLWAMAIVTIAKRRHNKSKSSQDPKPIPRGL